MMQWIVSATVVGLSIVSAVAEDPQPLFEPPPPLRPNILFITIDTIRADHLGCYGYPRETSPVLDALARESILFERCVVPMSTTLPSHLSMLTGVYPIEHGVTANLTTDGGQFVTSDQLKSFAEVAHAAGYFTTGVTSAAPLKKKTGVAAGFKAFRDSRGGSQPADLTNEQVFRWLSVKARKPWFLWIHYFDPHAPYEAPESFNALYETDEEIVCYVEERAFSENPWWMKEHQTQGQGQEIIDIWDAINLYDAEIRFTDFQIGRVFDHLRATGDWNNLIVVVIGDHGEGLNQHGEPGHGTIWDEQLHVPFMIRFPGQSPRRISHLVSGVDVFPTLLSLLDMPGSEGFLQQASGRNVLAEGHPLDAVFSQISDRHTVSGGAIYTLTSSQWKLIYVENEGVQLFNLSSDPYELINVAVENPDVAGRFQNEILARKSAQEKKAQRFKATTAPMEKESLDQLRQLGYVGDEEDEEEEAGESETNDESDKNNLTSPPRKRSRPQHGC